MLANPHHRKVRRHKRRRVVSVALRRKTNPHRRRRTVHLGARHLVRRRRSNPNGGQRVGLGNWMGMVRIGAFGGVGIVVARIGGGLYTQYLSPTVLGMGQNQGQAQQGSWQTYLNEFLRLLSMGVSSWMASRVIARVARPQDAQALLIGGLAETGRQAIGVVYKQAGGTTPATYGLDGQMWQDKDGRVFEWNAQRAGWQLAGVVPGSAFNGMGELVSNDAFAGRR